MKKVYLALAVLGGVIPCIFFEHFIMEHGVSLPEFVRQLFATSPSAGFTVDILISSAVFWVWSYREAQLRTMNHWWVYVLLNLSIGLSLALPLFLYFRQRKVEASCSSTSLPADEETPLAVA